VIARRALRDIPRERERFEARARLAGIVTGLFLALLFGRFFYLQVLRYDHYHTLAESNRISILPVPPNRGMILDRRGVVVAHNFAAYTLEVTPSRSGNLDAMLAELGRLVEITPAHVKRFKRLVAESRRFESLPVRTRLSDEEVARFAANAWRFPGVKLSARQFRQYPDADSLSHLVGYIGRINADDETRLEESGDIANYRGSDHIGKVGVEQSYEAALHGITGAEHVETDASGRAMRVLARAAPVAGDNLLLHLDIDLQQIAEQAFGEHRGALVALDPNSGGVLAFVSKPGFDPNLFVDGIDSATWSELNTSPDRPMVNRALRGVYPPGSTFKPFMALAGLELGLRRPGDTISDPGYYALPGSSHRYRDWKPGGHGTVDLKKSVVISCDTYYYRLAHDMGIDRLNAYIGQFGFGAKSGIDMDGELSGLLPSRDWKQRRFKQPWYPGETVIAGIGQGYNLATPLQLAVATATIANGGTVYAPRLVRALRDGRTGAMETVPPSVVRRIDFKSANLNLVRDAMVAVTQPGGTAAMAGANAPYRFAGKTGTAQVVGIKQNERYDERRVAERHRDHALFIAFAPADAPRIALAVLVENGGHGGSTAAPIARQVLDFYLLGKRPKGAAPEVGDPEAEPGQPPEARRG
jgi:penicillin-binding protein 2